ncbi:hypothetical protein [Sphingomonas alpina]|uniref:DUF3617 family protein n=1 Tax=Sphingomonas alpina TaxID=653931 RepID=A0A7H0LJ78_9SPHN|nr:hypothetical protein [Sphingomonas alpina]QNQ09731.1 hypothetical protein H3Z74_00240 [Sphingomonas alpina]
MTIAKSATLLLVALAIGGASTSSVAGRKGTWLSQELAGRIPGTPTDCIDLSRVDGPMIVDMHTILYRQSGKRIWRMDVGNTCPALREDMVLVIRPSDSRLCRNDTFQALDRDSRVPSISCRIGQFVPYDRP